MSPAEGERMRWAAARLIVNPGLAPWAAEALLHALIDGARNAAGDASFGDLSAMGALAEFLFLAAQLDLARAPAGEG